MWRNEKTAPARVECWRWRYRDARTGRICRTTFVLSAEQASGLMDAQRIPGSMSMRDVADFADTMPAWFELDAAGMGSRSALA